MLDATLFNISLPAVSNDNSKALVLSGCGIQILEQRPYSEFEELNFYQLNNNDFEYGKANIELRFENIFKDPYCKFFVQCVSIRTDRNILCKINKNNLSKEFYPSYTKITKEGKLAIGISYCFRKEEEQQMLLNCKSFCIEGFIAIKKKCNVYGFMCCVEKNKNYWIMLEGNTYQICKRTNIDNLYH